MFIEQFEDDVNHSFWPSATRRQARTRRRYQAVQFHHQLQMSQHLFEKFPIYLQKNLKDLEKHKEALKLLNISWLTFIASPGTNIKDCKDLAFLSQ